VRRGKGGEEVGWLPDHTVFAVGTLAWDLQEDYRNVRVHALNASVDASNLPVAAGDPGSTRTPLRLPPIRIGSRPRRCRCESGGGRRLRWVSSPSLPAVAAIAGKSPLPGGRRCPSSPFGRERNGGRWLTPPSVQLWVSIAWRRPRSPGVPEFPRPVGAALR
jgi:hypothetical protein